MKTDMIPFWLKTGAAFLAGSGKSAFMLSFMVIAAVSSLIFLSSLAVGVNDTMIRNSAGMFSGHITIASIPGSMNADSLKIKGVSDILTRLYLAGSISKGDKSAHIILSGIDPESESRTTALAKKKTAGAFIEKGRNGLYLSSIAGESLGAAPGDSILFTPEEGSGTIRFTLSGIYRTGIDDIDRKLAFCPEDVLPERFQVIRSASVFLNDGVDPGPVMENYRKKYPFLELKSWKEIMPDLLQLIELNYVSMNIVMILVFGVVSIGIACAFAIFILKNMREYGIMKSMGVTPGEVAALIMFEIFLVNTVSLIAGAAVGVLAVYIAAGTGIDLTSFTSHNRYFALSGVVIPRLTLYSLLIPPMLALVFSLLSGIWPALLVSGKKAVRILGSR